MIVKEQVKRDILVIVDVKCDLCGQSCKVNKGGRMNYLSYSSFGANWGYYSDHDGQKWEAQFCNSCSDRIKAWTESQGGRINVEEQ